MIYNFLSDYLSIIIFLFIALFLSIGFIVANFLASPSNPDPEKLSAYECGFEAFDDSRICLLYTSPSPRDLSTSRMPSSA